LFSEHSANKSITFAAPILYHIILVGVKHFQITLQKICYKLFVDTLEKSAIIDNMKTQYTQTQLNRFHRFCDRHGLKFNNMAEYCGALKQFFSEDDE
jgi:hypothetical protein